MNEDFGSAETANQAPGLGFGILAENKAGGGVEGEIQQFCKVIGEKLQLLTESEVQILIYRTREDECTAVRSRFVDIRKE